MSHTIGLIQRVLFGIEEEWGVPTASEKRLLVALELCEFSSLMCPPRRGFRGRPQHDRRAIARAFVAMKRLDIPTRGGLIDRLASAERGAARFKDDFGARHLRVRGPTKVFADLMLSVVALAADILIRLLF